MSSDSQNTTHPTVAIVGMAGRFPGADSIEEFWANLCAGKVSIEQFDKSALRSRDEATLHPDSNYVAARSVLRNVEMFDAEFFGIYPREAELLDPQHRIFLECAWEALESAGYDPGHSNGSVGVFGGCALSTYLLNNVLKSRKDLEEIVGTFQVGNYNTVIGNDKDFMPSRVSYKLNLRGPSVSVQTACSTSLVAICQACQSLLVYGCDMALAGGVSISLPQERGHTHVEGGISSADGACRPFDANAKGTVFGNGAAVLLLKRLDDALADRDTIHAVIRGFAVNNDGAGKIAYTAPSVEGQAEVIANAQAMAGVPVESITYIESHGTGTPLGDPIEIAALSKVFKARTEKRNFCTVGSVKGNVGHLDVAAGATGLIKTVLALKHRTLPALAHFKSLNPQIESADSPFIFSGRTESWHAGDSPLRAGVSAFGVGGTNAHVVVEQAPEQADSAPDTSPQLLALSARSEAALRKQALNLAEHLETNEAIKLVDAAYTLQAGRREFTHRATLVTDSRRSAIDALKNFAPSNLSRGVAEHNDAPVVFMFPGQGAQYPEMGRELYESFPTYRQTFDRCADILRPLLGLDVRKILFPSSQQKAEAERLVLQTINAQPALFCVEYSLALLWIQAGIRPTAMIGHSVGEFVAACVADVFSVEDALRLVAERGRLMQSLPGGSMLAVRLSERDLAPLLPRTCEIAAVNAAELCVVSGPTEVIAALRNTFETRSVPARNLHTSHAFHSAMMDPILDSFLDAASKIELRAPRIPYISCVLGDWITPERAVDPAYWAQHVRRTVRFSAGIKVLLQKEQRVYLETGPGRTLTTLLRQHKSNAKAAASLSGPPLKSSDTDAFLSAAGTLWCHGARPDWQSLRRGSGRRVPLPTYPFERKKHWIDPVPSDVAEIPMATTLTATNPLMERSTMTSKPETPARAARLECELVKLFAEMSGKAESELDVDAGFIQLGFDSLFLTQACQRLQRKFGVKVTFRQLLGSVTSLRLLAAYIDTALPPETTQPSQSVANKTNVGAMGVGAETTVCADPSREFVKNVIQQQLRIMAQQLEVLGGAPLATIPPVSSCRDEYEKEFSPKDETLHKTSSLDKMVVPVTADLNDAQKEFIATFSAKYTAKTKRSKELAARHRQAHADPRSVLGFNPAWKEIVYPLTVERSKGARLWDVDGNEYIDFLNDFGPVLLGHSPDFITEALRTQLDAGIEVGPMTPNAGKLAELFCKLTGMERCSFVCTGSEAVQAALRAARTFTAREKVVVFSKDYHGNFDEVLVKAQSRGGQPASTPHAPGVPQESVANMIVLDYGTEEALNYIRTHAHELAAVLVEPVQSRRPEWRPREFLQNVRRITQESGTILIFDEMVTGFRCHFGGAQAYFGVSADLATYGKVAGGGLPIGVVAGKSFVMDVFDGGQWQYGDDSVPESGVTFFAGTFVRHPLSIASALAAMEYLQQQGPALQEKLAKTGDVFAQVLHQFCKEQRVPIEVPNFGSQFFIRVAPHARYGLLLFALLRNKGFYALENFPSYITTAHTDQDLRQASSIFKECVLEMQAAGLLSSVFSESTPTPTPVQSSSPLTEPQLEILLAAQRSVTANCAFNESVSLRLSGTLNVPALCDALNVVRERHEALRATVSSDGKTLTIEPHRRLSIPLTNLSLLNSAERNANLERMIAEEGTQPFDLFAGPLVRAHMIKLSETEHVLLFTAHHIVCDGWTGNMIFEETGRIYSAITNSVAPNLETPLSFSQYATEQCARLDSSEGQKTERYWIERFSPAPEPIELPVDRQRTPERTYNGATYVATIPGSTLKAVRQFCADHNRTLFAAMLGGFQMLLHRLSGAERVVVGIPAAGQSELGADALLGHCINFLPIDARFVAEQTASESIRQTVASLLDAYEHQDYTYGRLVRKLKIERNASRLPLLEVEFNLEKVGQGVAFDGLVTSLQANPKCAVVFDLFLNAVELTDGLRIEVDYNTDLFNRETIGRWAGHYEQLLLSLSQSPTVPVDRLNLLSAADRVALLQNWNNTAADYPAHARIHDLFAAQALRIPESVAVVSEFQSMTYAELDRFSNQIARYLQARGSGVGTRVAVLLDRTPRLVAALLGVLKSGASYIPLDTIFPKERIATILDDAQPTLVLTESAFKEWLGSSYHSILLDELDELETIEGVSAKSAVSSSDCAYVIYTSGTTGKPKGVAISHRNVVNFLCSMQASPGITPCDSLLAVTTLSFDIAGLELFLPLSYGARVVLASREDVQDGRRLLELIRREKITLLQATPITWRLLLSAGWEGTAGLKMLCGGEALPADLVPLLLERGNELWNMYGPTETTIWSSATRVQSEDPVLLGPPIANTSFYILDAQMNPAPVGVPGELYIGGDGVAMGYVNRPELTAERFVLDPFSSAPGARMYRTGDMARWLPNGLVEFLGRGDNQVKLRGYRIELGEIEAAIQQHPAIRECAVVARNGMDGLQLAAYIVPRPSSTNDSDTGVSFWKAQWENTISAALEDKGDIREQRFDIDRAAVAWTGQETASQQLDEWIAQSVERILRFKPVSILELGCGTGQLTARLLPHVERYVATDFAQAAMDALRLRLEATPELAAKTTLLQRPADDVSGFEPASFDMVVIHSVAQYFPNADYLQKVLKNALACTKPGGVVYLGDVQSFALLKAFHAGAQLRHTPASMPVADFQSRIAKRISLERELVADPAYFQCLAAELGAGGVDVQLRRGRSRNEITQFHYDVFIYAQPIRPTARIDQHLDWNRDSLTLELLKTKAKCLSKGTLCVSNIPNARTHFELEVCRLLAQSDAKTVGELAESVRETAHCIEPDDLWELAEELKLGLAVRWPDDGQSGVMEALFSADGHVPLIALKPPTSLDASRFINTPLTNSTGGEDLSRTLRESLARKLPEYMVPALFTELERLPRTPNGKLDRKALPTPAVPSIRADEYTAPRNEMEARLCRIWEDVLRLPKVGVESDIFALGGDSLLIFQIVTRAAQAGLKIPIPSVFKHRTIAAIVQATLDSNESCKATHKLGDGPSIRRVDREARRVRRA